MLLGMSAAGPLAAQARQFVQPTCDISKGHYLINSAVLYLQNAGRTRFQDQRARDLRDAHRVLNEAITEKGQDQNGAAWYYLARYYQEVQDLPGADSAFTRAQALLPACAGDIRENRRRLWVPILNRAVDQIKNGDNAGAIEGLRQANSIYRDEPPGFYYMGQIFATLQERDSAIVYYTRALEISFLPHNADNAAYEEGRKDAAFNIARLYHMEERYDSAVVWYSRFRERYPHDPQALTGQAAALEDAGRAADAVALYDSVLVLADSMPTIELFQAGVAMFRAGRLERAAEAFEIGATRNPYFRDGLFNLANTYLSLANAIDSTKPLAERNQLRRDFGAKMSPVAARLVDVDPRSSAALRLLAASHQLRGDEDSTLAVLERMEELQFDLTVSMFVPSGAGYDVRGLITNRRSESTSVPALTFEFVTEAGVVVESLTIDAQTLEADGLAPFTLAPAGEGIAAWRYHVAP
jgi:tetratricopeptide (TPR) repeat protein